MIRSVASSKTRLLRRWGRLPPPELARMGRAVLPLAIRGCASAPVAAILPLDGLGTLATCAPIDPAGLDGIRCTMGSNGVGGTGGSISSSDNLLGWRGAEKPDLGLASTAGEFPRCWRLLKWKDQRWSGAWWRFEFNLRRRSDGLLHLFPEQSSIRKTPCGIHCKRFENDIIECL